MASTIESEWNHAPNIPAELSRTGKGHRRGLQHILLTTLAFSVFICAPLKLSANDLRDQTLAAWDAYVGAASARAEARAKDTFFLRISELPGERMRVRAGETLVWREGDHNPAKVPHGLIHDWSGAIFIPGAKIEDVLTVIRDYNRYPTIYTPVIVRANRLDSAENDDRFSMLVMQKVLFVNAAVKGEYETQYYQVGAKRWYSISKSTRLQSVENYGQASMRELPPDVGPGYVWRLASFTRFEESDGGVYIELEALGLSRDVPMMVRWLVDPIVEHLPRNSICATLEETRIAVMARTNGEETTVVSAASRTP